MKNCLAFIFFSIVASTTCAQNYSVDSNLGKAEDLFSAKLNLFGASVAYEKALTDEFTIEGEFGYFGLFFDDDFINDDSNYAFFAQASIEPKYYYNFDRRVNKGKRTTNNSANYFSTSLILISGELSIIDDEDNSDGNIYGIIPKYGFRRVFNDHFSFEFAIGLGYAWEDSFSDGIPFPALNTSFIYVF